MQSSIDKRGKRQQDRRLNESSLEQPDSVATCFHRHGYAVVRNVFATAEVAALKDAADRVKRRGFELGESVRQGNLGYWVTEDPGIGTNVIGMQWPSYRESVLERHRRDPRMLRLLEPLIGRNIRQIVNQLHSSRALAVGDDRVNGFASAV